MTLQADAFVEALKALCLAHHIDLTVEVDPYVTDLAFRLAPLAQGEEPLRSAKWDDALSPSEAWPLPMPETLITACPSCGGRTFECATCANTVEAVWVRPWAEEGSA
jgi:hypothetical protein